MKHMVVKNMDNRNEEVTKEAINVLAVSMEGEHREAWAGTK